MNRQDGIDIVRETLAECLEADLEEITVESRLVGDLGADSLDFVDLIFLLEERFGVELRGGELDALTRLDPGSADVMQDGHLTEAVLEQLRPWLRQLEGVSEVSPGQVFGMITVESIWLAIERVVSNKPNP